MDTPFLLGANALEALGLAVAPVVTEGTDEVETDPEAECANVFVAPTAPSDLLQSILSLLLTRFSVAELKNALDKMQD